MDYDINDTSLGLEREHEALAWLRENDPVHWDTKNDAWLLTRNADVRAVLNDAKLWSSAHGYFPPLFMRDTKNSIITMDDPEHASRRALLARAFTPRMLQRQASRIRALMDDAIDALAISARCQCDFVSALATPLPMRMIAGMVGFEDADSQEFARLSDALFEFTSAAKAEPAAVRGVEAFVSLSEHIGRAVAERRRAPREDLLSVLVEGAEERDVLEFGALLVSAGNETTRHTLSRGVHALLEHPDQLALLRAEPERIPLAVEECIRWASVVRGVRRTACRDTSVTGQKIRAGEQVMLLFPSANRDAEVFDAPFEFRMGRSPNRHLAFSEGVHFCLGANLARLEMQIALEQLLERLPGLRLSPGAQPRLVPKLTALTNGVERLDVAYDGVAPRRSH